MKTAEENVSQLPEFSQYLVDEINGYQHMRDGWKEGTKDYEAYDLVIRVLRKAADKYIAVESYASQPSPVMSTEQVEELAEEHADEYYDRNSQIKTEILESIQWQNRKFNFIDGYNAATSPSVKPMSAEQVEEDAINSRFDNDKFIENVCLSYNHGFGLMAEQDKQALRFECKEWMRAIKNNWKYHVSTPSVKADIDLPVLLAKFSDYLASVQIKYSGSNFKGNIEIAREFLSQQPSVKADGYDLQKLYDWIMDENRKPAITAFTSSVARNIASEFEFRLSKHKTAMSAEQVCRWIKASERMPDVAGVNVVIKFKRHGYEYCTFGRKNFDKEAAMYFEYGYESFITTDCEWLDESPSVKADGWVSVDKEKEFQKVLKCLKNNKVMVDTREDGIYIRLAGRESEGEAFTLHFALAYPFPKLPPHQT